MRIFKQKCFYEMITIRCSFIFNHFQLIGFNKMLYRFFFSFPAISEVYSIRFGFFIFFKLKVFKSVQFFVSEIQFL